MIGIIVIGVVTLIGLIGIFYFFRRDSDWGFYISFVFAFVMSIAFVIKLNDKHEKEKYTLYELKLIDNTIVRDSLYNEKEYFYDKKGTQYYKTSIIYSKKIDTKNL
ncbi:hypothetical protein [uncultured Capnocytophaga sp.]|uniref:hypothetical protein n=1 Tax=uncultured Capnocytophaga sp. TaxID=159273 RepID=UPI002619C00A|nr:hypothetical protein [uncultured Capnocytophaga sp.]